MTKDVILTIRGVQYLMDESGEQEPIEVVTPGTYYQKNGSQYLLYDEVLEGVGENTHNQIRFGDGKMEVRKSGSVDVHMIFEENKKNLAFYQTPYGAIHMGIATTGVRTVQETDYIRLQAEYALELNENYVGDCIIDIEVRPKEYIRQCLAQ